MKGHKLKMKFKLSYEDREDVVVHTELLTNQFVDYKNYDVDDLLDIVPHTEEELIGFTTEWVLREEDNRVFIRQLMNSDESIIRTVDPYYGNEESSESGYTERWDLDEVLTSNFDKWWRGHSHLFVETPTRTTEILKPENMVLEDYYRYFRIDSRMSNTDTIQSMRQHLKSNRRRSRWSSKWTPLGEIRQEKLFNIYNTMIMWLQGMSTKEILTSGLFRTSRGRKVRYEVDVGSGGSSSSFYRGKKNRGQFEKRSSKVNSDRMRKDLLEPGRRLVLIVCDGYFSKHPRGKRYFGK